MSLVVWGIGHKAFDDFADPGWLFFGRIVAGPLYDLQLRPGDAGGEHCLVFRRKQKILASRHDERWRLDLA